MEKNQRVQLKYALRWYSNGIPKTVYGYVTCHSREVDTEIKIKKRKGQNWGSGSQSHVCQGSGRIHGTWCKGLDSNLKDTEGLNEGIEGERLGRVRAAAKMYNDNSLRIIVTRIH